MKYLYSISYCILACIAIFFIHKISPTDMAGPGLDIIVYFLTILSSVVLVAKSIMKVRKGNQSSYIYFFINTIGLLVIILTVYFV